MGNCAVLQGLWCAKRVAEVLGLVSGSCCWNVCPSTTGKSGAVQHNLERVHSVLEYTDATVVMDKEAMDDVSRHRTPT